ncbi:MAG TPA: hypothetical protein VK815_08470, partial [Candidatus Acidoferrales bacterium]|nr:hypothetical protein [Candidatus Acidoferrales bacterium]
MFNHPPSSASGKRTSSRRGTTLIEMLVALACGAAIVGSILTTGTTLTTTMVAIGNYCDLNRASRQTLDVMSADLRNTASVTSFSSSSITVSNVLTGDMISYAWDGTNKLTRTFNQLSTVMLTHCDYLCFSNFQRNPLANFQFVTATTPADTKLVSVSWRCS